MDAYLISRIFAELVYNGYINEEQLLEQSARYMTLHQTAPKPANTGHPLLPLDVLVAPSSGEKLPCMTCSRSLSLQCFPKSARGLSGDRNCFVCRAVNLNKAERAAKKAAGKQPGSSNKSQTRDRLDRARGHLGEPGTEQPKFYIGLAIPYNGIPDIIYPDADGKVGIFGYDDEDTPGGTYLRDMYDSD